MYLDPPMMLIPKRKDRFEEHFMLQVTIDARGFNIHGRFGARFYQKGAFSSVADEFLYAL